MNNPNLDQLPVSELLALSQSNVTHDPSEGLVYATEAYNRSILASDDSPFATASGVAARQAGFRSEQLGLEPDEVSKWFKKSYDALSEEGDIRFRRERIATHLLEGRALALRLLIRNEITSDETTEAATRAFRNADGIVLDQHKTARTWDSYSSMLDRHWSTFEAMSGSAVTSGELVLRGMYRALRSAKEDSANIPETADRPQGLVKHVKFVVKQTLLNGLNGVLAISRPLDKINFVQSWRTKMAVWMLG